MDYNKLKNLFIERSSVRKYLDKEVEEEKILKIIDAAKYAPSSCNRQSWKVFIVKKGTYNHDILSKTNCGGAGFANKAPLLFLMLVDLRTYGMPIEMNFPVNDGSIVASYIMLTAKSLGLDTCWISWQAKREKTDTVLNKLKIKSFYFPVCVLSLGYRNGSIDPPPRENAEYYLYKI